jgi:hypothetical protein
VATTNHVTPPAKVMAPIRRFLKKKKDEDAEHHHEERDVFLPQQGDVLRVEGLPDQPLRQEVEQVGDGQPEPEPVRLQMAATQSEDRHRAQRHRHGVDHVEELRPGAEPVRRLAVEAEVVVVGVEVDVASPHQPLEGDEVQNHQSDEHRLGQGVA